MASSSSSSSTPDFSSQLWKYHVFLSFRGEDTRKTFVDHLYTALDQKGIYTYKDDVTLPRGESIGSSLKKAIEESQIAVIVFSENYVDSTWCLDELEYIMRCKDTRGQIILPVFYHVDPSEMRKEKRKYGEAFAKHELQNKNKVESWRKSLVDASNVSGWEPKHVANGHESQCIKEIVDAISHRLHPITTNVDESLVGVEARMQHLILKLQIGSGGKRMIGIWGVGGGGKTTLASSIYDEISNEFEGSCFVKNIREESSNKNGLENLQAEILSGVLKQKGVMVGRVEEGRGTMKDRLRHRKVLIVLDDVDNLDHLKELAGSRDWFGEGSRIIITTRDEHVLTAHKVDVIHNISLLSDDEAMKLFCKHAPRGHRRIEDYEHLSKSVVSYAGGLPLALRVLGCFLCDKEINEWKSALDRLQEIPDDKILEKLKISFDGLKPVEKELFLHIACFFRGDGKDESMMILDACGYYPVIGVKVLIQKALITISDDGKFDMHDLVQEMGHHIVRGEHPTNPEKHSRVWKDQDVLKICAMDEMTNLDRIEAIRCDYLTLSKVSQPFLQVVANMKKLRCIDLMDHESRLLLPQNFPPRELRCLTLNCLAANKLWEGYKFLPNLRMIKLVKFDFLVKTPDFDGLPNLERFIVWGSSSLEEIDSSFGHLQKLVWVEIGRCFALKKLPPITRSKKLETFILSECLGLFNSSKVQQNIQNVQHLQQPFLPHNMNRIRRLFSNKCLTKLDLNRCYLHDEDINPTALWELPNLQKLNLSHNNFSRLNFSLLSLPRLKYLNVSFCCWLVELSELPSSVALVVAVNCYSLESLGDISNCKWLWNVAFEGKNKLSPIIGENLLHSMLQGNAKDHYISLTISDVNIWKGLNWGKRFRMLLSDDWYDEYCGVLMFAKTKEEYPYINIIMKRGVDEDFRSELRRESEEEPYLWGKICVGYISFSSLRHTSFLNSTYDFVSFSLGREDVYPDGVEGKFRAVLVPRKSEDGSMQTPDVSEFWDYELDDNKAFRIQHVSNSSIKILWTPHGKLVNPFSQVFQLDEFIFGE